MTSAHEPKRIHIWLGAAFVVGLFVVLCDAKLYRPGDVFTITENIQIAEAQAWWQGRLDLPERKWDSALFDGQVFSHFPPMFSILSALIVPVFHGVPHWFIVLAIALPIPLLAYALSRRLVGSAFGSAMLATGLVCGTSALPVLEKALRGASPYAVNQALALIGLLIFLCEYFGRGRVWVAGVGVVIAAWSRQMTLAYLLPLAWMAYRNGISDQSAFRDSAAPAGAVGNEDRDNQGLRFASPLATNLGPYRGRTTTHGESSSKGASSAQMGMIPRGLKSAARWLGFFTPRSLPKRRVFVALTARFGLIVTLAVGVPLGINWLKFGHPLESGYMYVYEGREDDVFVRDARAHGLFSTWYVPRNLYYANLGFPEVHRINRGEEREWYATPNDWGTGIWWTTPFSLYLFADWRRILGSPRERMLLFAAGLAYIGLMLYHSTGLDQRGLNRYSLDYLPALFALAAPGSIATPRRKCLTASFIVWGVLYFAVARHVTNIRIW